MNIEEYLENYNLSSLRHCYLHENKIYGMLSGDSRLRYALFIYDIKEKSYCMFQKLIQTITGIAWWITHGFINMKMDCFI